MKIIGIIDSLGSGGAQRQFIYLMKLLKQRGHIVEVLTYYQYDFFLPVLIECGISITFIDTHSSVDRIWKFRKEIRYRNPDTVIAFLNTPSLLAEFSALPRTDCRIIVSERSYDIKGITTDNLRRFICHSIADRIVTNSYSQAEFIVKTAPWLKKKVVTIINCVDLNVFHPPAAEPESDTVVVAGSFVSWKNPRNLLYGLKLALAKDTHCNLRIEWYGKNLCEDNAKSSEALYFKNIMREIENEGLDSEFRWHQPHNNIEKLYQEAGCVCLPSFFEGCPNVICEAMSCGRPILASGVGDIPHLIEDGVNGFLFQPDSPESIAGALLRFSKMSAEERIAMGRTNRIKAEKLFSFESFIYKYETVCGIGDL